MIKQCCIERQSYKSRIICGLIGKKIVEFNFFLEMWISSRINFFRDVVNSNSILFIFINLTKFKSVDGCNKNQYIINGTMKMIDVHCVRDSLFYSQTVKNTEYTNLDPWSFCWGKNRKEELWIYGDLGAMSPKLTSSHNQLDLH